MKTSSFKQQVTVHASPLMVYAVLMSPKKHAELTGSSVKLDAHTGGLFEVYDGYAHGRTLELVPGRRIVQAWQAKEDRWPKDHFSTISFDLHAADGGKTTIRFEHRDVPASLAEQFKSGWREFYWEPLKRMFPPGGR